MFGVYGEGPVLWIKSTAEDDAVGAWEHVAGSNVSVVDLGLRHQDLELSARRYQLFVAEERPGAEPAAVEDNGRRPRRRGGSLLASGVC